MSLIKDTSHLQIPYSSETPDEDIHTFLTVDVMVERITKHQDHMYCFRTVGVIFCVGQSFYLQKLDDPSAVMRVSLKFLRFQLPFIGIPFTAHLFGFAHWREGIGPVLFPLRVATIAPYLARRLQFTMERAIERYLAMNPGAARCWGRKWNKNE